MKQSFGAGWVMALAAGIVLVLGACAPSGPQGAPDVNATVQAALAQTRAVQDAVATFVAATGEAQQTATAQAAGIATPTLTTLPATPTPAPSSGPTATPAPTATSLPSATPVPSPTPVPTPTPTPTEERIVLAETAVDGSDGDGREILISSSPTNGGRVIFLPNFNQAQVTSPVVFGNYVTARVAVFDTRRSGQQDGSGIRQVRFEVFGPTGGTYTRVEETAPYCLFGGNDPLCPGIDVRRNRAEWPDGQYFAAITIEALDGLTSNWNWTFCVNTCDFVPAPYVELAQIGRNSLDTTVSGELVFQVIAYQENIGTGDGNGIDYVDFYVYGPDDDNDQAWYKREETAAYCAFGGDVPCPGARVGTPGRYRLVAIAVGQDGQQTRVEQVIEVQP